METELIEGNLYTLIGEGRFKDDYGFFTASETVTIIPESKEDVKAKDFIGVFGNSPFYSPSMSELTVYREGVRNVRAILPPEKFYYDYYTKVRKEEVSEKYFQTGKCFQRYKESTIELLVATHSNIIIGGVGTSIMKIEDIVFYSWLTLPILQIFLDNNGKVGKIPITKLSQKPVELTKKEVYELFSRRIAI